MPKEFYACHLAYPSVTPDPEIFFGFYDFEDGEPCGEMAMRWHMLGLGYVPRLEVFNDSWEVLNILAHDLLPALAERDNENITPDEFMDLLRELGFKDRTDYSAAHRNLKARLAGLEKEADEIRTALGEV